MKISDYVSKRVYDGIRIIPKDSKLYALLARVAQRRERPVPTGEVGGSNPPASPITRE